VIALSRDGTRLATLVGGVPTAKVWDARTGELVRTLNEHNVVSGWVFGATFGRDNATVVTTHQDGTARMWDVASGDAIALFERHGGAVYSAVFSTNDDLLVTTSRDGTARVWDVGRRQTVAILEGHVGEAAAVFERGDDRLIITDARGVEVWDVRLDHTTASDLDALVRCRVPFRLSSDSLVLNERTECAR
jgi:WD40 repeat protein